MLKTNSKAARQNIINYIMQDLDYIEEAYNIYPETPTAALDAIWHIWQGEKQHDLERHNYINQYNIFKDWAQGLALGGLFCYYYNRPAVQDLGDILEETEEERNKYTEEQAEEMLSRLIFREIVEAHSRTSW